ncbi:ABC transporter permease [Nonomuraea sp. NPDC050310]|uniref:ABC transporter permease n=1 Tax=unclassified Nonomuraea TaxID=2593643 RepID=UPI003401D030
MVTYLIRRLFGALLMLIVVSMVTFSIFFLVPRAAGATPTDFASRYLGKSANQEMMVALAQKLGFYDPIPLQYWRWIKAVFVGDTFDTGTSIETCPAPCFGYSFLKNSPVWDDILSRLPVTLSLAIGAGIIWLVVGVAIGVLSALKKGTIFDRAAMTVALAGVSLPVFFTGMMSLVVFSYAWKLTAPGGSYTPITQDPLMWAYNLILPWITLAFLTAAAYARLTRAGMLETMSEDYIRTARAKGLRESKVIAKHGLRAALTPIVTIFGLDLGLLLGGAVLTESTFSLKGIGQFAIESIQTNDLPRIMGVTMVAASFIVFANLVVDLIYGLVDPRVRLG